MTRPETAANVIAKAAHQEGLNRSKPVYSKMYSKYRSGDGVEGFSQNLFTPGHQYIYLVSVHDAPISLADFHSLKSDIRATRGLYTIQYIPAGSKFRNAKFPYLIGQDLVRIKVLVSGPQHWDAMCDRIPELDWIKRNSTLTYDMFAIAKKHPGLVLRFGINFSKYCSTIESRAEELGIDIDHKPLVIYQWGASDCPRVEGASLDPVKTKQDYIKEIEEARAGITREEDL